MKICFINPADSPRKEVFELGSHLSKAGHEITILYPTKNKKLDSDVRIISFPARFLPKIHYTIPNFIAEYNLLLKLVTTEKYDIIQACDYDYLPSLVPVFINKKTKVPILVSTDAFPGHSWFFGNKFVDIIGKIYTRTVGKFIINSCDGVIVLSNNLVDDAVQLHIRKEKISVIPNGVDFCQFNLTVKAPDLRSKLFIENDEKVILFVGRLSLVKRVEILIKMAEELKNNGLKIKMLIVGDGEYEGYYKKLASSIENIVFVGSVPYSEIQNYFAIADVFVLPSLSEGLPNVLLEAAACGKPIVATNTGGISDIVVHGKNGYLIDKYDTSSFFNYTKKIILDDNLSKELGNYGYEHIKKEFDWAAIIKKYESLYTRIIDKSIDTKAEI